MIPITEEQANAFSITGIDDEGNFYNTVYPKFIEITSEEPLLIGFDQSTTQTGLFIKTTTGKFVAMIDIENMNSMPHSIYEQMMLVFLKNTFYQKKIELVVIEKPFKAKGKGSYETLVKLKGFMETLMYTVPEFRGVKLGEIYPQTWRKEFLANKTYTGRKKATKDLKQCAREETIKRYPLTEWYANLTTNAPDSCDAVGVLDGYIQTNYKDGVRVINTTMKANYQVKFDSMIALIDPDHLTDYFKQNAPKAAWYRGIETIKYNSDLSMQNNCIRAVAESNKFVCMAITDIQQMSVFMWESGIPYDSDKLYYLIAWRENIDEKYGIEGNFDDLERWGLTVADLK